MRSVNKVILIGNLTRDPEMRQTPNNQNVTTFGLATNRTWVTQGGDKKDSAEFHECVAWARLAEICNQYLKKGNLVYVEGYLKTRSWDSPEGVKKFKTEIVVQDMIILEKKRNNDEYSQSPAQEPASIQEPVETQEKESNGEEFVPSTEEVITSSDKAPTETIVEAPTEPIEEKKEEQPVEESTEESPIDKDLGL